MREAGIDGRPACEPGDPAGGPLSAFGRVELDVRDTTPNPPAAIRAAVAKRPHLIFGIFGPYGGWPTVAAVRATERVVWNHGGATSVLAWPDHGNVVNVLCRHRRQRRAPAAPAKHSALSRNVPGTPLRAGSR